MNAHRKLLILRGVISLSVLNTLIIFAFRKLLTGIKMLKMLMVFILSSPVFRMIIL